MQAVFVKFAPFQHQRKKYLSDDTYALLQELLSNDPKSGDVMVGNFWWEHGKQIWFMTIYSKHEASDLTDQQKSVYMKLLIDHLRRLQ